MARNKIGRNSPCICGSGKKYKKCCLSRGDVSQTPHQTTPNRKSEFILWLQQHASPELVATLAGLMICPDNLSHILRLERATQLAVAHLSLQHDTKKIPSYKSILDAF